MKVSAILYRGEQYKADYYSTTNSPLQCFCLCFVHHFYSEDFNTMLDADIYFSRRLEP